MKYNISLYALLSFVWKFLPRQNFAPTDPTCVTALFVKVET